MVKRSVQIYMGSTSFGVFILIFILTEISSVANLLDIGERSFSLILGDMEKLARSDWKRHSAPYDMATELGASPSISEVFDQAMFAFTSKPQKTPTAIPPQRTATIGRDRKKSVSVFSSERSELSTNENSPGVLKVYGESVVPGVQYKSVLASCRSTALELVKQALERFGLPTANYRQYVLCDVVGRYKIDKTANLGKDVRCGSSEASISTERWEGVLNRPLRDMDRPLLLQQFWKPMDGYHRRYELHTHLQITEQVDDDDTLGLNENARKILRSKLRPGAIPLYVASTLRPRHLSGVERRATGSSQPEPHTDSSDSETTQTRFKPSKVCSHENNASVPVKHPFFLLIRGFDVRKDKTIYVIKFKRFVVGNPHLKRQNDKQFEDVPKISVFAPDLSGAYCRFKVYRLKRNNGARSAAGEHSNYFLEVEPLEDNVSVNGCTIQDKALVKSGDIIQLGLYYVFLFKDCSKGHDIPLSVTWLSVPTRDDGNKVVSRDLRPCETSVDEMTSSVASSATDDSVDLSVSDRMCFSYAKDKEDELVRYICAIIQHQNTCQTYALTVAFMFAMCIEYSSRKSEKRHLKHLFLKILLTVRESVAVSSSSAFHLFLDFTSS